MYARISSTVWTTGQMLSNVDRLRLRLMLLSCIIWGLIYIIFILSCLLLRLILSYLNLSCSLFLAGHKKEKQKALSPAVVLENLRHTLVDYQNRCSNASIEVGVELIKLHRLSYGFFKLLNRKFGKFVATWLCDPLFILDGRCTSVSLVQITPYFSNFENMREFVC